MDIKQVLRDIIAGTDNTSWPRPALQVLCRDALAEIEGQAKVISILAVKARAAAVRPRFVDLRDAPKMPFQEVNGFGGALSTGHRLERIERFLNEFIASNR
jgi:hypothetical protein